VRKRASSPRTYALDLVAHCSGNVRDMANAPGSKAADYHSSCEIEDQVSASL
jgi:hypothetical protein